ncbi:MAG: autotransporter assembly complex protein TamA [Candidatus Accumulibacter sp.]|jgi:translocation and assembly module TamA|nr:autotransporter assembly complex protein TamA [Accumulibacter sp.]
MPLRRQFLPCLLLLAMLPMLPMLAWPAAFAAPGIVLEGPDELVARMTPHLPEEPPAPRRLQAMLEEMLATEGYFSPAFTISEAQGVPRVRVDPGPRTHVAEVAVGIDGPVDAETKRSLIAAWPLPVGRPFRQEDWSEAKQQVLSGLLAAAHAGARLVDSAAEIDARARQARLTARYDAGPPYRFGALRVTGLHRYPASLVARYNRAVEAGDPYREEDLAALQGALLATPYFAAARVTLDRDGALPGEGGTLIAPVNVDLRERPAHRFGFGAGVSSNTGARVEASYHTSNLFNQAWQFDSGLRVEQKQQTAYADVMLPPDARNRRHAFGLMVEASDIQGLRTTRHAFGVQTTQPRGSVEQRLSLNWERERRRPDGEEESVGRALAANVQWTWRRVDDPIDPRQGIVLQAQIGGGSKALLSDQNFVRLHGRWLQYIPLGERDSLALRAEAGATLAPSRRGIPQDYLFRAGGAGSVRGYSYQSLGVREGSATVGGRYLAVLSVEATHWISPAWGVAAFIDAGDAADNTGELDPAIGYGLGVRWKSPAGPLGADLAYGQRSGELRIHFALAIPF